MVQNSSQKIPKTRLRAVLSGSKCSKIEAWRGAVRLLGASWAILASEVRLGGVLGPSWGPSGAVMGPIGGVYGELLGVF